MKAGFKLNRVLERRTLVILVAAALGIGLISYMAYNAYISEEGSSEIQFVSGTAYISGESGQVIVRVSDRFTNPILGASCNATILYPDKTFFMVDAPMSPTSISGNYYREFTTPETTGIYEEIVRCEAPIGGTNVTLEISSSFQVSIALNVIVELAKNQTERFDAVMGEIDGLRANVTAVNESLNVRLDQVDERMIGVETTINTTVVDKFDNLYDAWSNVGQAIFGIFGQ